MEISRQLRDLLDNSRLAETKKYMQHGNTSCYAHTLAVALLSCKIADKLRMNVSRKELIRGALLHDYFLYDWHTNGTKNGLHGFTHPSTALKNADRDLKLTKLERDIIKNHMFPLTLIPPHSREGLLVCAADKYCSLKETFMRHPYKRVRNGK